MRTLVLAERRDADGTYYRAVVLRDDGDLCIEGHDLLRGASFGEYEFVRTVRAAHLPALRQALDGAAGDDLLQLISARFAGQGTLELERLLEAHAIPSEFWSRIGD